MLFEYGLKVKPVVKMGVSVRYVIVFYTMISCFNYLLVSNNATHEGLTDIVGWTDFDRGRQRRLGTKGGSAPPVT